MKGDVGTQPEIRILIVEDERDAADTLADALTRDGYVCDVVESVGAAITAMQRQPSDLVISDVMLGDATGLELLDRFAVTNPGVPVILVTGRSSVPGAVEATKRGAFHYLSKPYDLQTLEEVMAQALEEAFGAPEARNGRRKTPTRSRPVSRPRTPTSEIVGDHESVVELRAMIQRVAASTAPVLILGESGSGKDLVAHEIHEAGPRRDRPFVAINVAAIPEHLLESEMFGHVRGAFTGAGETRRGLFADAHTGTLFLDEIGDMPHALQAKLLRVLQFGELRSIGSDVVRSVDVRVIAATHRDLPAQIAAGRFREDLYFRLNVLPVIVPPLRIRRDDIPALARLFLEKARARAPGSPVRGFTDEAMERLKRAEWRGNVRELASVVERLTTLGANELVTAEDLAFLSPARNDGPPLADAVAEWATLREMSRRYVHRVLVETSGDKVRAAKILGVNLSTLYRWKRARATSE